MMRYFTAAELEEMRLADLEIEREFEANAAAKILDRATSAWLDRLAVEDLMSHEEKARKRRSAAYQAAYYQEHKDEIAAYQAAYREERRDAYNAYMRDYMREYRRGIRRKKAASCCV